MIKSKHRKHSSFKKINKSKRHIMKGGSPTDRMLANILTILELQFPETYKKAASDSDRWFDWKKHLYWDYLE
jgi:hypothetical protein